MDSYKEFFKSPKSLNSILNCGNYNSFSTSSKIARENKRINASFNSEVDKDKSLLDFYIVIISIFSIC